MGIGVATERDESGLWDLDGELTVPATFSAILLITTGALALLASRIRFNGRKTVWQLFGTLVLAMALDEFFTIHEYAERATGVDWQILYAPVILACAMAWLLATRALATLRPAYILMVLGAGSWVVSQILEFAQWDGDQEVSGYLTLMVIEETLEMTGSACFLMAFYIALTITGQVSANAAARH